MAANARRILRVGRSPIARLRKNASPLVRRADSLMRGRGASAAGPVYLLDYAEATITRATEAAFVDPRPPANGGTGGYAWDFVDSGAAAWKGNNVARIFSDGAVLIEGARNNEVPNSEDLDDPPWDHINSPTLTADDATAPDGSGADLITAASGGGAVQVRDALDDAAFTDAETSAWSCYLKSSASDSIRLYFRDKALANELLEDAALGTSWERIVRVVDNGSGGGDPLWGLLELAADTGAVWHAWGAQCETDVAYATSPIRTSGAAATRNKDQVSWATTPAEAAAGFARPAGWYIDVWPLWSSTDTHDQPNAYVLEIFGELVLYRAGYSGQNWSLDVGGTIVTCAGPAFSAGDQLRLHVTSVPSGPMSLRVENITTATDSTPDTDTGGAAAYAGALLTVGAFNGGSLRQFDGVISRPRAA